VGQLRLETATEFVESVACEVEVFGFQTCAGALRELIEQCLHPMQRC
jgi:hypothetical protein